MRGLGVAHADAATVEGGVGDGFHGRRMMGLLMASNIIWSLLGHSLGYLSAGRRNI
jgi:hypothetical protein